MKGALRYLPASWFGRLASLNYRQKNREPIVDWRHLIGSDLGRWASLIAARNADAPAPSVLIPTMTGGHRVLNAVESLLAVALALRGARPEILLCDAVLPACTECHFNRSASSAQFAKAGPQEMLCSGCYPPARAMYDALGIKVHTLSSLLTLEDRHNAAQLSGEADLSSVKQIAWSGIPVGEHAHAGVLRYFARGTLAGEPGEERIRRRYLEASYLTAFALDRLFKTRRFRSVAFNHGIYVPQGIVGAAARMNSVRLSNWVIAYRKGCFIFSHGNSYHHTMISEPVSAWENMVWGPAQSAHIDAYLRSRWTGTVDWITFQSKGGAAELTEIEQALGIDFAKPTIGLLTNVFWDAQLHFHANVFDNMRDWIVETIRYFEARSDLQLLIRIHPAELKGAIVSRQGMLEEIYAAFPQLPSNVFVIGPESGINTYAAMQGCDSAIIYGTKTGVELTSMGIPVIVAGEAWIRGKGIAIDATSRAQYREVLDSLPLRRRMEPEKVERARRYAFHFFFRRMIPLGMVESVPGHDPPFRFVISGLDDLLPGRDPGLDVICDGILNGAPFIFREEERIAALSPSGGGDKAGAVSREGVA